MIADERDAFKIHSLSFWREEQAFSCQQGGVVRVGQKKDGGKMERSKKTIFFCVFSVR